MKAKKMRRKVLPLTMAGLMVLSCVPATAAPGNLAVDDPWSIADATKTSVTYTVDGKELKATMYEDYYLDKDTSVFTDDQYENAKVAVIVPEGANANSPILYMVDNSGWQSDSYARANPLTDGSAYDTSAEGKGNQAALALKDGYVVVVAGLRSRNDGNQDHSPVTVADAKAVIRYLRYNDGFVGNAEKIFITGTSGGGALSVAIGADGNSADFYEELYAIGAAGMTDEETSTINDDVFGVVAYCPITDLGHADGSYEFVYSKTRETMLDTGFTKDSSGYSLSDSTMEVSPELAAWWAEYVTGLGLKDENGNALVAEFDTETRTASGTLYAGMKNLLIQTFQGALDELGKDKFLDTLEERSAVTGNRGYNGTTTIEDWQTNWITFSEDGKTIVDIDLEGCAYYVALGEVLKNAPAFTNQGTIEAGRNENNLFGQDEEAYGFLTEMVYNLQPENADLRVKYGDWKSYWEINGELLTKQAKMLDSISYLVSDDGDSAPYWYVRHGSKDRDTSFANQTLLYYAMINDQTIETVDFEFAWNRKHEGSYDITEAEAFMAEALEDAGNDDIDDPWSIDDATMIPAIYTIDGQKIAVTQYVDYYLKDTGDFTDQLYENAKVNIWVPENATSDSPILYMVNNGGWQMNTYSAELIRNVTADTDINPYDNGNMAAMALRNGYVVVTAGLRSRGSVDSEGNYNHSPVTVADAKAVIRYLRYNEAVVGDTDKIFITGTSGGGALSSAIGADGNSKDFYEELYTIGAAGMTDTDTSTLRDDVFGVIAYCPITDLGHADGSYDFTYAGVRQAMLNKGYSADSSNLVLNDTTMKLSPGLASGWADLVNNYDLVNGIGKDLTAAFDADNLKSSGTLYEGMEKLLVKCLQEALDDLGEEEFVATLEKRSVDAGYKIGTPEDDSWKTSWMTIEDGKIVDFDIEGYLYYVAIGQVLKPAPAFTNAGTTNDVGFNENNIFGNPEEKIGYLVQSVYDIDASGLDKTYGSWAKYWEANKDLLTKQVRMVDSIEYLVDTEDGDSATNWWVRHGSIDRDTGFANQTLLYYALLNDKNIDTVDFAFEWNTPHTGGYDVAGVEEFIAKSLAGEGYKVIVDDEEAVVEPVDPVDPVDPVNPAEPGNTDNNGTTINNNNTNTNNNNVSVNDPSTGKNGKTVASKTGDETNMALPIICVVVAGCVIAGAGVGIKRRRA